MTARSELESLLRARKLDVTLTSTTSVSTPGATPPGADDLAVTGVPAIDAALDGGLRRGHLSEIVGRRSSGRTAAVCRALGAAVIRGELVALVDTCDRFDPESAAATGLDLSRLLWIRDTGDATRALKAMNLVLQAGGFGLVVLDLADVAPRAVRALPFTTWYRLARVIEGSQTVALLVAAEHLARSSGGATIAMGGTETNAGTPVPSLSRARWTGRSDRARLLQGLDTRPRVVRPRS
jgi:recombination protein RecA